mmetsp:Transcript_3000/g.6354  ORF Transcript_3000/g.6354 Transcript_3000/m.6354 type:complete len:719 (+) Transcript_3000:315-2471(+)
MSNNNQITMTDITTHYNLINNNNSMRNSQRRRRRRRRTTALGFSTLVTVLLHSSSLPTPTNAFGPTSPARRSFSSSSTSSSTHQQQPQTALYFRTGSVMEGTETFTTNSPVLSSSLLHTTATAVSPAITPTRTNNKKNRSRLPPWLATRKAHLTEFHLRQLQQALQESYFTENESLKLLFAIEEAAAGDRQQIAGAAEFCVMLLETMDLGLEALVGAAFHYCSCVTAREQETLVLTENCNMASFGDQVAQIARDAARLKELELLASRVVEQKQQPAQADAENLRMMLLSESKDWRALAIRSAACLYRLRGLLDSQNVDGLDPEKVRVAREALWIYAPISSRLGMHRLKNELEGAAFQILYKRQYEQVLAFTSERITPDGPTAQEAMNEVLNHVQEEMTTMLQGDEQFAGLVKDFTVSARVKEPYSMWRKMVKHGYQHIWEVPDAIALRIVLNAKPMSQEEPTETIRARERALCYYAQRLCSDRWEPQALNPRFKDYIENPKPNGYQSLHYTARAVYGNKDWSLEIQVRSGDMHQVAEFGLASHWDYKSQKKTSAQTGKQQSQSSDAYLNLVQQWHWEQQGGAALNDDESDLDDFWLGGPESTSKDGLLFDSKLRAERIRSRTQRIQPYIDALATAQSDLSRDFVFVFFEPRGSVLSLPAGACVVDALRKGCDGAAWQHLSATNLNGRQSTATKRLCNGDVLEFKAASAAETTTTTVVP